MDLNEDLEKGQQLPKVDAADPVPDEIRSEPHQTGQSLTTDHSGFNILSSQTDASLAFLPYVEVFRLDFIKALNGNYSHRMIQHKNLDEFQKSLEDRNPESGLEVDDIQLLVIIKQTEMPIRLKHSTQSKWDQEKAEKAKIEPSKRKALENCVYKYLAQRKVPKSLIWGFVRQFLSPEFKQPIDGQYSNSFHLNWMLISSPRLKDDEKSLIKESNPRTRLPFPGNKPRLLGFNRCTVAKRVAVDYLLLPRTILIVVDDFRGVETILNNLVTGLKSKISQTTSGETIHKLIQLQFCQTILYDERMCLSHLEEALHEIDCDLGDQELHKRWALWQSFLALYRPYMHSRYQLKRKLYRVIKLAMQAEGPDEKVQTLKERCADFETEIDDAMRHVESTSAALMGLMNIVESSKAIKEAEEVTKLTQLAFFFIPLTFAAGVFGMNSKVSRILLRPRFFTKESKELANLSIWIWIVTSVILLLTTYSVLYYNGIQKMVMSRWSPWKNSLKPDWKFSFLDNLHILNNLATIEEGKVSFAITEEERILSW